MKREIDVNDTFSNEECSYKSDLQFMIKSFKFIPTFLNEVKLDQRELKSYAANTI